MPLEDKKASFANLSKFALAFLRKYYSWIIILLIIAAIVWATWLLPRPPSHSAYAFDAALQQAHINPASPSPVVASRQYAIPASAAILQDQTNPTIPPSADDSMPELSLPESGVVHRFTDMEDVAPLEIKSNGDANYLLKIVDASSKSSVIAIFVRAGADVSVDVPLGDFEIQYACGQKWYGYNDLFGANTLYSKADTILSFRYENSQILGHTITLFPVANGNFQTSRISKEQFWSN